MRNRSERTNRARVAGAIVSAGLLFCSVGLAQAQRFVPACANPTFPGARTTIDQQCSIKGAGGSAAEVQQNSLKNNFCADGQPTELTFDKLQQLQASVEQDSSINFGDPGNHGSHGPTTDRGPLANMGEGSLVQLRAFVLKARQEGAESVNCGHDFDDANNKNAFHDIHISLVETDQLSNPTPENECTGIVAEMIPHSRPRRWTAPNINKVHDARLPVRVTGHLFFDSSHVPCDGSNGVRSNPKRISLWEIHPIYSFEVCTADCDGAATWVTLEDWLSQQPGTGPQPRARAQRKH